MLSFSQEKAQLSGSALIRRLRYGTGASRSCASAATEWSCIKSVNFSLRAAICHNKPYQRNVDPSISHKFYGGVAVQSCLILMIVRKGSSMRSPGFGCRFSHVSINEAEVAAGSPSVLLKAESLRDWCLRLMQQLQGQTIALGG